MAYNETLAARVREYLSEIPKLKLEEKKMFRGLAFLVNGKMCINISGDNLMCRFDPAIQEEVAGRRGFEPMIMKGREMNGYCYVNADGYRTKKDFEWWMTTCLHFNPKAKASKKK